MELNGARCGYGLAGGLGPFGRSADAPCSNAQRMSRATRRVNGAALRLGLRPATTIHTLAHILVGEPASTPPGYALE